MPENLATITEVLANPLLEDARNWFVDRHGLRTRIKGLVLDLETGKIDAKHVADVEFNDAHLISVGLEMLDELSAPGCNSETYMLAEIIFLRSNAAKGWEVRALPSGGKHIVRVGDEIVLTQKPMNVTEVEAEYISRLPWMLQYTLDRWNTDKETSTN